jgi:hypothetical protein
MAAPIDLDSLAQRLRRIELLFATLIVTDADKGTYDENTWHALQQVLRNDDHYPGLYFLLERLQKASSRQDPKFQQFQEQISDLKFQTEKLRMELQSVLRERIGALEERVGSLGDESKSLQVETHSLLAIQALGLPTERVRATRFVPVRAYIDQTPQGAVRAISDAVNDVLEAFGFVIADEFPEIRGSWFQKWFAKSTELLSQPEVHERLEKIERAVEIKAIDKPQADIDDKQAAAIAKLVKCLDKIPNAAIQAGSVLVVKLTVNGSPVIQARTLTQEEMIELENNQLLLQDPAQVLSKLNDACSTAKRIPRTKASSGAAG